MKLNMFGTGYVGLVTGACFAQNEDNHVICTDIDSEKIERLKNGEIPIFEEGLEELVRAGLEKGNLEFTTDAEYGMTDTLVQFICVGTPSLPDGSADLKYVESVAKTIGQHLDNYKVIVDKSTVPLGTGRQVQNIIQKELNKRNADRPFSIVSCPEFLKEGSAVEDFSKPDRVVIGSDSEVALDIMSELFAPLLQNGNPLLRMGLEDAEFVKYCSNTILANRIAINQEFARMAEEHTKQTGHKVDMLNVKQGMTSDKRIGTSFLHLGPGYGGSCFPKDTRELAHHSITQGLDLPLVQGINKSNELHKQYLLEKVLETYDNVTGKNFGIWGLAFKAKTDDMRESSAITIINGLLDQGANVNCYDPEAMDEARNIFGDRVTYHADKYSAAKNADGLIVLTEWDTFKTPNVERLKDLMNTHKLFDYRNLYGPRTRNAEPLENKLRKLGFEYYGVGR